MTITGAIVIFAVLWFMGLLIALPIGLQTHGDAGSADAQNPASAPVNANIRRKMLWVTGITIVLWALICGIIASGWIGIADIDFFDRLNS